MNLLIRPVRVSDAEGIHRMNLQETVFPYMIWLPSQRQQQIESMLQNLSPHEHRFVAELDGKIVGFLGLNQSQAGRRSHIGDLFIEVDEEHHGQGIGKALMQKALELADNWLFLERVELEVLATNPRAQAMYERFGFVVEGRKTGAIRSAGEYVDLIFMARFRPQGVLVKRERV